MDVSPITRIESSYLLDQFLDEFGSKLGIGSTSIVHDNASGSGTATEELLKWCKSKNIYAPSIVATDSDEALISKLDKTVSDNSEWVTVKTQVMDSDDLKFKTDNFSHTFCNFSVQAFEQPIEALKEIHRTLLPKGLAVISSWKRNGVAEVMGAAQKALKGEDYEPAPKQKQFSDKSFLAYLVEDAGWERGKIRAIEISLTLTQGKDLDGLAKAMSNEAILPSTEHWTDEEKQRWPSAVKEAFEQEKRMNGGLVMEAWFVLARKWDLLTA